METNAAEPGTGSRIPDVAERACTIAARVGTAAVVPARAGDTSTALRITPHLHHVHRDATVTLLLHDEHPLVATALQTPHGALTAMIEIADQAPVPLREPVRGLLWLTGQLGLADGDAAREATLAVAEERPDPRLLDAGHGFVVLRMTPASIVLADAEGSGSVSPAGFAAAVPDPFHDREAHWLRHLDMAHRDVVHQLRRHLPEELHGGNLRPLGLDRFGIRLRVEAADSDHDVRLPFPHPVETARDLGTALRHLLGCPFLAQQQRS